MSKVKTEIKNKIQFKMDPSERAAAIEEMRNMINNALRDNDARTVDFYHIFINLAEMHCFWKKLNDLNLPQLRSIISYVNRQIEYLTSELVKFDVEFQRFD